MFVGKMSIILEDSQEEAGLENKTKLVCIQLLDTTADRGRWTALQ